MKLHHRIAAVLTSMAAAALPAHAARECEQPDFTPTVGACARLPGAELYYIDTGPAATGKGEAVIFLHSASSNAESFKHNLQAFRSAGYRAIAFDRKNVGRSSNTLRDDALGRPHGTTVQGVEALARHLGLERFHLVGIAAGAQVALQVAAADRQGRVASLVLVATLGPPGLAGNEPDLAALQANIALPFEIICPTAVANPPPEPLKLARATTAASVQVPAVLLEHRELGTTFRATNRTGVDNFERLGQNARHRSFDGCRATNAGAEQPGLAGNDPRNPNRFARLASLIDVRTLLLADTGDVFYSPPA